jgi:hypothetical protein
MVLVMLFMSLCDTSVLTDKLCRIETRRDLHRMHSRGRLHVSDTAVVSPRLGSHRVDGYVGTTGFTTRPSAASVPLEFEWVFAGDTIFCGESRFYVLRRKHSRFDRISNNPSGQGRCRVSLVAGEKLLIFVRFPSYTDIYINNR